MKELNVYLNFSKKEKLFVGTIAQSENQFFFEYAASFLSDPLWLSPYKLPPESGLHKHKDTDFGPIFGLFDDSLPDGWGLLLMDRFLRKQGIDIDRLSVLDRLSFLGKSTMGALTYEPAVIHEKSDNVIDLEMLAEQSRQIMEGHTMDVLPQLMKAGGSPGGARPKVLVGIKNKNIISGEDDLPEGFEHWIVKFNAKEDFPESGAVEYAYSLMAKEAGILMPETRLFELSPQGRYFGIKRFDRKTDQRFHVQSFGSLIHSNFRVPGCDYETFLKVILDLTKNHQDLERGFLQMIFNVSANNRDDHVKNFAFMIDANREWKLTPAYDVIYSKGPGGEHSMSLAGEGRAPGREEIFKLGYKCGMSKNKINDCLEKVITAVKKWSDYAHIAGVTEQTKDYIQNRMDKNQS
ncbi:MAG: type II toxin-antitoxin system HipA family toxin [Deltaproteobacteria bacterium]|uniref:type II toxin-antitoxin system HipA family toxin n=1 Tax=Desulfobacula sp. TaxID=2593537 RepID=UPI001999EDD9|nr:type II toxin-antitoxin system HipA family toxin [Candidatus Desulfobacula maris]MBL6992680.1 type II toxin-antitoxin system HipA family toxin [Desulfobacula sp.]